MKNNKLIKYKDNIFSKIKNLLKKVFNKDNVEEIEITTNNNMYSNKFFDSIAIKKDEEQMRLKKLQLQYDNGEIKESDISREDVDKIIKMYKEETNLLNEDTNRRRKNIEIILKKMRVKPVDN